MKIKIIDLLNMISKGEELPKKIKYDDKIYYMVGNNDYENYEYEETPTLLFAVGSTSYINDDIEIIEDTPKEDKKIEKFKDYIPIGLTSVGADFRKQDVFESLIKIGDKINEIIDFINKGE